MSEHAAVLRRVTEAIVGAAIEVHRTLGPGLLEGAYEACLAHELALRGHSIERQRILPVTYKGVTVDHALRIDLIVDDAVIVELKAVSEVMPAHEAQLLTYLRLSGYDVGLLLNFHARLLRNGIRRMARAGANLPYSPPRTGARNI
jgi:GxxExxY protein